MFDLDLRLFSTIYTQCKILGGCFGFEAFEEFIMYSGVILLAITEVMNKKVKK